MKILIVVLVITSIISCKDKSKASLDSTSDASNVPTIFAKDTQLNLYSSSITIPKGWRRANDDTLPKFTDATARYRFHNKNGKLIYLQYGLGTIGNPAEPIVISARARKGYIRNKLDTTDIIFSDNPRLDNIRKTSEYLFYVTNTAGFQAILFKPKLIGQGYTGIYIDSIGEIAGNIADLVLYADDLDSLENIEIEKITKTLVLKHFE